MNYWFPFEVKINKLKLFILFIVLTYSDVPTLLQAAGQNTAALEGLLGTITPAEMVRILVAYTTAWMNGAFTGTEGGPLLQGQEPGKFPEVSTVMKGNF